MRRLPKLSFAVKFGLAISALAVGMTTISVSFLYAQTYSLLVRQTAGRLKDVGQTGSFFLLDGSAQASIRRLKVASEAQSLPITTKMLATPPGETVMALPPEAAAELMASADFQYLVQIMRRIGEASRAELGEPQTAYAQPDLDQETNPITISTYLMVEIPESPDHQIVKFIADGLYEPQGDWPGNPIGNLYSIPDPFFAAAFEGQAQIASSFYTDDFGTWLTAVVPIRTPEGEVIAVLGLDFDATREVAQVRQLKWLCGVAVLVSLGLSAVVAVSLARWLGPPIAEMQAGAERVRNRDYSTFVSVKSPSELRLLAVAFNAMVQEIRTYAVSLEAQNKALEKRVEERTEELTQTLTVLKATQTELLIENALLRDSDQPSNYDYQVGGSLPLESLTYVVRQADRQLYQALRRGQYCYIFNARQMGKSSLRVQMARRMQIEGATCVAVDLSVIGNHQTTVEQWYTGLMYVLAGSLGLRKQVDVRTWWRDHKFLSPLQRLGEFVSQIILVQITGNIIVFIDEVDSVLSLEFEADDFFIWLRNCFNQRADNNNYRRLTFVLLGVATPSQLMQDPHRTPFNIGQAIELNRFQLHEAHPLLQGLSDKVARPQSILGEVLAWTGGQPFLSQKVCQLIRDMDEPIPEGEEQARIEQLVRSHLIDSWETKDDPEHLKTIRDRILSTSTPTKPMLEIYQQLLRSDPVLVDDSPAQTELRLSGLVIRQGRYLGIANRLYAEVFNQAWVVNTLQQT
ncbi:MAG: AAA-like domain-containing protein [Cyanobacteria bacterium P01_A01_bin.114]